MCWERTVCELCCSCIRTHAAIVYSLVLHRRVSLLSICTMRRRYACQSVVISRKHVRYFSILFLQILKSPSGLELSSRQVRSRGSFRFGKAFAVCSRACACVGTWSRLDLRSPCGAQDMVGPCTPCGRKCLVCSTVPMPSCRCCLLRIPWQRPGWFMPTSSCLHQA